MVAMDCTADLELIAQRVLKLAEIATLEHLQGLLDSQAEGVLVMAETEKTKDERRNPKSEFYEEVGMGAAVWGNADVTGGDE